MPGVPVEVRDVTRRFLRGGEEVWALRGVSLRVEPGEFLALIGRSGSGKTTLLNLIAGLDRPTSGEVEVGGARVDRMSERERTRYRRRVVGFVFQSFALLPLLSASENVELPLRIAGWPARARSERARQLLALVGLAKRAHHRPYELSGGEQQRVAIARALAVQPSLLLADEPTGELDSVTAMEIFQLLRDVARSEGVTVIVCTHDRLVAEYAGRIEELRDGRLAPPAERDVWQRWQARGAPPRMPGLRPAPVAPALEPPPSSEPSEEDISRWAPPERRQR
ncbi:putative ABC transporter ATP-binding protein [bacterium HR29]|jgi:putative ABC transport system ATP-binding protein|nr:putative ABC transporter ATP-binding protein [bacterium HR29]